MRKPAYIGAAAAIVLAATLAWGISALNRQRDNQAASAGGIEKHTRPESEPPSNAPPGMVWIPAGEFTMGTDDAASMPNERPSHRVQVSGFWIDSKAVTNADFRKFIEATRYVTTAERPVVWEELKKQVPPGTPKPPDDMLQPGALVFTPTDHPVDLRNIGNWWTWTNGANWKRPQGPTSNIEGKERFPVVQVSWDDAVAYAKWAGKQLPTEAQWEYAARGGKPLTRFSWGDEFTPGGKYMCNSFTGEFPYRNTAADGYAGVAPVASFPANGYGLFDMAGNVWNWCSDFYEPEMHALGKTAGVCCDPIGPDQSSAGAGTARVDHVIKGGSYLCNPAYCESYRPTARRGTPFDTGSEHVGFRCVMTPSSGKP